MPLRRSTPPRTRLAEKLGRLLACGKKRLFDLRGPQLGSPILPYQHCSHPNLRGRGLLPTDLRVIGDRGAANRLYRQIDVDEISKLSGRLNSMVMRARGIRP